MLGQKIGDKYQLVRLIGQGAMGTVYEAKHADTGRRVAVKLITDEAAQNEQLVARFERESQATAQILTPHIVEILDTGRDAGSGHPYIVMELLEGENVEQLFARVGPLEPELVARIGAQACLGLQKAHQAGVVHRDVKPANLFLAKSADGECVLKLLDFGVAKLKMDHASETGNESLTRTGSVIGSPMYMSPEQARGLKSIDHRTDIWSLGVVLYELLAGDPPHHDATGLGDLIIAICAEEPALTAERVAGVPKPLSEAIHGALRLSVDDRYADAKGMLAALDAWLPAGRDINESMLVARSGASAGPSVDPSAFATVVMDTNVEEPTRASAQHAVGSGSRPPSAGVVKVEDAKDGPTVTSPIEQLVLSAGSPLAATVVSPERPSGDSGLFGPAATRGPVEPGAVADAPVEESGGSAGSSLARGAGSVAIGLLLGVAVTFAVNAMFPPAPAGDGPDVPREPLAVAPSAERAQPAPSSASPSADSSTTAAPSELTTATVKVIPPFGAVAVDGQRVEMTNGAIEIRGPLDSAHDVVLTVGGRTKTARVRLTADGPKPDEIVFPGAGGPSPAGTGRVPPRKRPDIYE